MQPFDFTVLAREQQENDSGHSRTRSFALLDIECDRNRIAGNPDSRLSTERQVVARGDALELALENARELIEIILGDLKTAAIAG